MSTTRRRFVLNTAVALAGSTLAAIPAGRASKRSILPFSEYRGYDATGLAALVRSGDASPRQLLDIAIARVEAVNPVLNGLTLRHFDMAYDAIARGLPEGPLRGVPYLLKDLGIAMRDTITTDGSVLFRDKMYPYDSTLTQRYRNAGLVMFGKTHSPEFGGTASSESQLFGSTRNPWNTALSAGGSSGGSAALVAAGVVPMAHASDGGGSIRIPASACGLFGLKPTRGRVPMGPMNYETRNGLSAMHAVTRSVRDSALLLDLTQGGELGDAYSAPQHARPYSDEIKRSPGKLRIALMTQPLLPIPVADDCVAAAQQAAKLCASLGHEVVEAAPDLDALELWGALGVSSTVLTAKKVAARERELGRSAKPGDLEKVTHLYVEEGKQVTAVQYSESRSVLHAASRTIANFMQDYDVILSPTMALVPPPIGELALSQPYESFTGKAGAASGFTALYNMTGQPAMSVPLHWNDSSVPIGVMFAGRFGDEATLFRLAAQLEKAQPWFDRLPQI